MTLVTLSKAVASLVVALFLINFSDIAPTTALATGCSQHILDYTYAYSARETPSLLDGKPKASVILTTSGLSDNSSYLDIPLTKEAIKDNKRDVSNIILPPTTLVTSATGNTTVTPCLAGIVEPNVSTYVALYAMPTVKPAHSDTIYTLTVPSNEDVPNALRLKCASLASMSATDHSQTMFRSNPGNQLSHREIIEPTDGLMTTMTGVATSVPLLLTTYTITVTIPSSQTEHASSITDLPRSSPISSNNSNIVNTTINGNAEKVKPAQVAAIVIPSVFIACLTFFTVVYRRLHREAGASQVNVAEQGALAPTIQHYEVEMSPVTPTRVAQSERPETWSFRLSATPSPPNEDETTIKVAKQRRRDACYVVETKREERWTGEKNIEEDK